MALSHSSITEEIAFKKFLFSVEANKIRDLTDRNERGEKESWTVWGRGRDEIASKFWLELVI
jgi:hypothetical protein